MRTTQAANPQIDEPDDEAQALAARQLAHLEELREIGMRLARNLDARAADTTIAPAIDIGLAFSRIARSVRQIVVLEEEVAGLRETHRKAIGRSRMLEGRTIVRRAVRDAHKAERPGVDPRDVTERINDLLNDYDDYNDFDYATGEIRDIVAQICGDLGVPPPDPALWDGLVGGDGSSDRHREAPLRRGDPDSGLLRFTRNDEMGVDARPGRDVPLLQDTEKRRGATGYGHDDPKSRHGPGPP